jgi:hypothetical protein
MILKITLKNNSAQEIVDIIREIIRARDWSLPKDQLDITALLSSK